MMEALAIIEGQVDKVEKERNTMICQLKAKDGEIFKLKSNINLLKDETCKATGIKDEMERSIAKENEEIFKMKSDIISLKIEENEAIFIKEEIEKQLAKNTNDCKILEEVIVTFRRKVEGMDKILKSPQALDDMLSHQISPFNKSHLGYTRESSSKNDNASKRKNVRKPELNVDSPSSSKGKEKSQDNYRRNLTLRRLVDVVKNTKDNEYHQRISRQKDFRSTLRKPPSPRYQSLFLDYCYVCTNFAHMEKYFRAYHKDRCYGP